jgi:membrane protease YdiL (CAAX protease family)
MSMSQTIDEYDTPAGVIRTLGKAIGSGVLVALAGLGSWSGVLYAGSANSAFLPWVVPAMGLILIAGITYLEWGAWPRTGRAFRRRAVRLNAVSLRPFLLALAAGWSTMLCGFCLYVAHRTLNGMGGEGLLALPHASFSVLWPGLIMAGAVAGVVEEIAFRGFMQGTLERRFGVAPAILISGLLWAVFHLNHSYFAEEPLLWPAIFLAVATILGTIAHRTDSLIPGIAVHAGFDSAYFLVAGLLAPRFAPIAFVQSVADPQMLAVVAVVAGVIALMSWTSFFRATRVRQI